MSIISNHFRELLVLAVIVALVAVSYSWTFTPYGRLDYRAALSLKLLSFERTIKPDPDLDFELSIPVNLIYAISFALPGEKVREARDIVIPDGERDIPARVYWPAEPAPPSSPLPVIVFYHGGGFVVGSIDIFDSLTRSLANATSAIVVSVGYRLAPAHPYPAAPDDAYLALEWVADNADSLGADPGRLVVAGESAGGNLAAVVALKARDLGGPRIAAQLLYYPATDLTGTSYPSREKFADGYGLSTRSAEAFSAAYSGNVADKTAPYLSPLYAPSLADLPPALMVTAGFDPLTDACNAYAQRLTEAQVPVTARHYPDMFHGFMNISVFPPRREALTATASFLDELFDGPPGRTRD